MVEKDAPVTVEVNEAGNVIDLHRVPVEMDFAERPKTELGHHISVNGDVTRIQSGVIRKNAGRAIYHQHQKRSVRCEGWRQGDLVDQSRKTWWWIIIGRGCRRLRIA
jgi:hypothetical protein